MVVVTLPLDEPALVFAALFLAVLLAPLAAERARLPGLIGLILAGVAIGPYGLGILEREGSMALLGGVGLLYLMFQAGVELDLDDFVEHRRKAFVFGAATFAFPMVIGTVGHLAMGFSMAAGLLLASAWASHTLLAYPVLQRFGVVRHPAVAVTVGATIITDTAALVVLAVVARAHQGELDAAFAISFVPALGLAGAAILWALPAIARWFFAGIGQARPVRFLFVVVALYASAAMAELAGTEAIVGAFLAGLALNRLVAPGSVLAGQVEFFGSTFLVPVFLISVGMLVDPALPFEEPVSLARGAAFVVIITVSKWLAAVVAGKGFGYGRDEIGTMFSLSVAQAAATLAAVFVGVQIGLLGERTLNAVVLAILATSLMASFAASRYGARLPRPPLKAGALGQTVLLPISNPVNAGPLAKLAAAIAAADSGTVVPARVLDLEAKHEDVRDEREQLVDVVEEAILGGGADVRSIVRLDVTPAAGILHLVIEEHATCLAVGWKGYTTRRGAFFGERVDTLLALSQVPVVVCRPSADPKVRRVVVSVSVEDLGMAGTPALELALLIAARLADQHRCPLLVVTQRTDRRLDHLLEGHKAELVEDQRKPPLAMRSHSVEGDLVVVGIPPAQAGLGPNIPRLAAAVPDRTFLAVAPR